MHVLLLPTESVRLNIGSWVPTGNDIQLEGYQLYAVEKWIVDRTKPVELLIVYTGDQSHKISLTPLSPSPSLPQKQAEAQWEKTLHHLRRNARPKETPHGTLMVTSLAHFRSDYTIVHIPNGNLLQVKQQLYANINLLRMGCSGRTALTLEEPSDTTKDRFISMYHLPASTLGKRQKDQRLFTLTVLELVKLIQAGLYVFGFFSAEPDGLLCDETVEGLRKWAGEIGEAFVGELEPTERIADPMVVSSLLSLVLAMRNKLAALGYNHVCSLNSKSCFPL